jgi:hypothetical protein
MQRIIVGVVRTSVGDLMSFMLAAKVCLTNVKGNMIGYPVYSKYNIGIFQVR